MYLELTYVRTSYWSFVQIFPLLLFAISGDVIPQSDGREGDEDEVEGIQKLPGRLQVAEK